MTAQKRRGTINSTHKLKNRKTTRKTREQIDRDKGVKPQNWRPLGETRVPNYRKMQKLKENINHSKSTGTEEITPL